VEETVYGAAGGQDGGLTRRGAIGRTFRSQPSLMFRFWKANADFGHLLSILVWV
jgi:hypothetical protein